MKHKKLSISIVSAFIAALGLTACSNVTADDKAIVSLKGYDGSDISVITDTIYDKYKVSEDGLTSFYQAILEVMIRDHFESEKAEPETKADFKKFDESARNDVKEDKEKARDNSETNKTSYDVEWKAILDAANVKDEEGLYQKHLYDYEKEAYQDDYFEDHKAELTSEYIGFKDSLESTNANGTSMYPYHIRHILVKTTADAKNYVTSEITASEAQRLNTVYEALVSGKNSFGAVAKQWSEDGSAKDFGDAGIMTTATSFVNEFKLGIYAYDIVYGKDVTGDETEAHENLKDIEAVNDKLGLNGAYNESTTVSVKDKLNEIGLGEVSYEVFEFLGDEYKTETDKDGYKVNDGLAKSFPRNIFWNNYLNMHNVFVITDEALETGVHQDKYDKPAAAEAGKTGFRTVAELEPAIGAGKKVLTDEDGRVIVGVRSEFGIHFMIMERTPFEVKGSETVASINEYYTTLKPGDDGFPTNPTYVNHLNAVDASVYAQRAKTVKEEIKGFDKMYDYRMYEELINEGKVEINDEQVAKELDIYIQNKRANNIWSIEKELNNAWNTYLDMISLQNEVKKPEAKRMVKPTCAIKFKDRKDAAFSKTGGAGGSVGECYYEA